MGLIPFGAPAPLFLRNGELLGHSPILIHVHTSRACLGSGDIQPLWDLKSTKRTITLHSLKIMESFDNRFTSQVDFNNHSFSVMGNFFENSVKILKLFVRVGR
jgi:hypothetical protein